MSLELINIGPGNGLEPSGNNLLPVPMLTQIYVTTWRHQTTINLAMP